MDFTKLFSDRRLLLCWIISLSVSVFLAIATYYINFWPTDSWNAYLPAATKLFDQPFVSQVHDKVGFTLIMRGKESLVLGIAIMQRILGDFETLYPIILLLIVAVNISSILIYIIGKKIFNAHTGLMCFLFFACCFWPYLYILQAAHPPLVLMNCLAACYMLLVTEKHRLFFVLSGIFSGFMMFSSPTSTLYVPYVFCFFFYQS